MKKKIVVSFLFGVSLFPTPIMCQEAQLELPLTSTDPCLQISETALSRKEKNIADLICHRQYRRYAGYTLLTGTTIYGLLYFFKMHDFGLQHNLDQATIVTKGDLAHAHATLVKDYGLTKVTEQKVLPDAQKAKNAALEMIKSLAITAKDTTLSLIHLSIVNNLYQKAKDMVLSDDSIKWYYLTEIAAADKAQRLMYFADQYEYATRTAIPSRVDLQLHFLREHAYDYIDALMSLIAFMRYKATSLQESNTQSLNPAFTSLIEAATLYATNMASVLEQALSGKMSSGLREEVYKTHKLIESLYLKFLTLEERYR